MQSLKVISGKDLTIISLGKGTVTAPFRVFYSWESRNYLVCPHPKSLSQAGRETLKGFNSPYPFLGEGAGG